MGLFTQKQQNTISVQKQQTNFLAKTSLIAGICFAIVFFGSFFLSKYWLASEASVEGFNLCYILGTIGLITAVVFSFVLSFKGLNASILGYSGMLAIFTISYTFIFACYFSFFGNELMFYSLAYTSIALILTAVVAYFIKDKAANIILKVSMWSLGLYFIIAMTGSLLFWALTPAVFEWYYYLINILIGVAIICSNIYTFYQLKKMEQFTEIQNLDSQTYTKLVLSQATSLLLSIIQTFILIMRLLAIFGRD